MKWDERQTIKQFEMEVGSDLENIEVFKEKALEQMELNLILTVTPLKRWNEPHMNVFSVRRAQYRLTILKFINKARLDCGCLFFT